jgi:uncharacterized protein
MRHLAKFHYLRSAILAASICCHGVAVAGLDEGIAAHERGDYATALSEFKPLADQGVARAQNSLGAMYAAGQGLPKDIQQAVALFRKAADQADPRAQRNLGIAYASGFGLSKDEQQAVLWFRRAADQGDATGQFSLGTMYASGRGVTKDEQQADYWYRKAADQGQVSAQYNLGNKYAKGSGVLKDEQQAASWYRKAADQGHAQSQHFLGFMYSNGQGLPKDKRQAALWYRKAADQGHASAQLNLAVLYALGEGVPKDDEQSVFWFRKSAEHGDVSAQHFLGLRYSRGDSVALDISQAYFWQLLASAQGNAAALKQREVLEPLLTPTQRAAVQAAARDWRATLPGSPGSGSPSFVTVAPVPVTPTPRALRLDSTGSGFAIAVGRVITNAHVAEGCSRVDVAGQGAVIVSAIDARSDLALLATNANKSSFASLRSGRLRQGDAVTVVGFPLRGILATGAQVTTGNVSALAGMQNDSRFIQISAPVQPGNSGGPLVDASGNVAGVVVSKLNAKKIAEITGDIPQNVNFAVSPLVLQGFLDANGVNYQSAPSNKNLSTADVADIAKRYTVLVECWK